MHELSMKLCISRWKDSFTDTRVFDHLSQSGYLGCHRGRELLGRTADGLESTIDKLTLSFCCFEVAHDLVIELVDCACGCFGRCEHARHSHRFISRNAAR